MIICSDKLCNGMRIITICASWSEAQGLLEAAKHTHTIVTCTIRDLENGRYLSEEFSAFPELKRLQ
jgi:hypothetical protein